MDENRSATLSETTRIDLTATDVELVRTALKLLEDMLGRDEADELREVQALLARLPSGS